MKVCVDVSAAVHRRAGLGRYAQELTAALVEQGEHEYIAFYHQRGEAHLEPPIDRLPRITTRLSVKPWRLTTMLAYFTSLGMDRLLPDVDLFHGTEHLLPRLRRVRTVFTLHDLIFRFDPDSHLPLNRIYLNLMVPRFLKAADAIIVVSECTQRDAVRLYGVPSERIHVIPEGVHPRFRPIADLTRLAAVRDKYGLPSRFVLHVGTIEPRKNLPMLMKSWEAVKSEERGRDDLKLVIAGKPGWLYKETFATADRLGLADDVIFTGYMEDADLPVLYNAATALAMPSRYEGFGLPIAEAMACGTPVVCSDVSSLPEVAGDAALLVPPDDVRGWVEALTHVISDEGLRGTLREKGLKQAAKFSWERAAHQTGQVYSGVMSQRGNGSTWKSMCGTPSGPTTAG